MIFAPESTRPRRKAVTGKPRLGVEKLRVALAISAIQRVRSRAQLSQHQADRNPPNAVAALKTADRTRLNVSLLKLWLRELVDSLVPSEMYNNIAFANDSEACCAAVERLPTANRRVVLFVISFLQLFLNERVLATTKMTSANLALVMAPNLLRCGSDSMTVVFNNAQ
jgi:RhoGAP domain